METREPNSVEKPETYLEGPNSSFNKCCCILLSFLFLSLTLVSAATLLVIFVLKPKKPIFHLNSIQLHSFKLNVSSFPKQVSVSPSMASLLFVMQNPNKLGIRYSPSELGVVYEAIPIGAVEVPAFYQPAYSKNVSVLMHVSIQRFNVTDIINGSHVQIQILGCIGVQPHVLNFPLPKIKVSLDCRIDIDYGISTISKAVESIKRHKALLLSDFPHLLQKCSASLV